MTAHLKTPLSRCLSLQMTPHWLASFRTVTSLLTDRRLRSTQGSWGSGGVCSRSSCSNSTTLAPVSTSVYRPSSSTWAWPPPPEDAAFCLRNGQCVHFALKHAAETYLMKGLSHSMLSVLVNLTDTESKHNGPRHNFKDLLCFKYILKTTLFFPEDLSFHIVMWPR